MYIEKGGEIMNITYHWSHKILPLVYEEAMSYYEQLLYLTSKIEELIRESESADQSLQDQINSLISETNKYTDGQIAILKAQIDALSEDVQKNIVLLTEYVGDEIQKLRDYVKNEIDEFGYEFYEKIADLDNRMSGVYTELARFRILQEKRNKQLERELYEKIEGWQADRTGATILVRNPVSKAISSLNSALMDILYEIRAIGGLTMREYRSLGLSMEEYAGYGLTMESYALRARFVFFYKLVMEKYFDEVHQKIRELNEKLERQREEFYMWNPYTGTVTHINRVIGGIMGQISHSPTMAEYRKMQDFNWFNEYNKYSRSTGITLERYRNRFYEHYFGFVNFYAPENTIKGITDLDLQYRTGDNYIEMFAFGRIAPDGQLVLNYPNDLGASVCDVNATVWEGDSSMWTYFTTGQKEHMAKLVGLGNSPYAEQSFAMSWKLLWKGVK